MFDINPVTSPIEMDCGPTCLKMLLSFYGQEVDLKKLIDECHVRLDGCTCKSLKYAGIAHGLDMRVYEMDADEIIRQDRPSIIWWLYSHWCILCGTDDNGKVVIINPDRGRYRMSVETFKSFYTGIALFDGEPADLPA